jgi:Uma2 family endonuclease
VVEVISPESRARDTLEKFHEYEQVGIPEYWLVDSVREQVRCYQLGPDGKYVLAFDGASGEYQSAVLPRLRFPVEWLWQEAHPGPLEIARRLGLLSG